MKKQPTNSGARLWLAIWLLLSSLSAPAKDKADHWAFKPLVPPTPPEVQPVAWVRNPIDRFVLAGLQRVGLGASPEAARVGLLRRVHFSLTGLPPSPAEVDAFLADRSEQAYENVVDRLLESPRYGERWARHWLDVISFGETHGFEVNTPRDNAWPYRDYVIRAFNDDKPYPEFIRDQLAGDATGQDAATGFIVAKAALLPGQIGRDLESILLARQDELNDMVLGAGSAFLGLTIHCARCHDHKFDPISQRDYYSLTAFFSGVRHGERLLRTPGDEQRRHEAEELKPTLHEVEQELAQFEPLARPDGPPDGTGTAPLRAGVSPRLNVDRFAPVTTRRVRFTIEGATSLEPCLDELEVFTAGTAPRNIALVSHGTHATASGTLPNSTQHRLEHLNDGRPGNDRSWISHETGRGWVELEFPEPAAIDRIVWARDREGKFSDRLATNYTIQVSTAADGWQVVASSVDRRPYVPNDKAGPVYATAGTDADASRKLAGLVERKKTLDAKLKELTRSPVVYAGTFIQPESVFRLNRGDPMQKREPVAPAAPARLGPPLELPADIPEQERRLALARWIADPANPLTARVLVNRLWHHHFGEGLVNTPSDFGNNGASPSNPGLLDWLAGEFVRGGWSIKRMQRLIVLSATFRQASRPRPEALAVDAGARTLWRFPPRRIEAEVIRDAMLAVCGTLDLRMGGPGYSVFAPNDNYVRVYDPKLEYGPADWRRMIYQTKVRMAQDSTFGVFDCPDAGQNQPRRPRSTTPLQALSLFNSAFVHQQAAAFASRLEREAAPDPDARVRHAYRLAFGRLPDVDEATLCRRLVDEHGLPAFCRVLLNANEFVFVD